MKYNAAFWAAIAAGFSAFASLLMVLIHRRNWLEAARPELILSDWHRTIPEAEIPGKDVLSIGKIQNVGKGVALQVVINNDGMSGEVGTPITSMMSTVMVPILPVGKEEDIQGRISFYWTSAKPLLDRKLIQTVVTASCFDIRGYLYETEYFLNVFDKPETPSGVMIITGATSISPTISLLRGRTKVTSALRLSIARKINIVRKKLAIDRENHDRLRHFLLRCRDKVNGRI